MLCQENIPPNEKWCVIERYSSLESNTRWNKEGWMFSLTSHAEEKLKEGLGNGEERSFIKFANIFANLKCQHSHRDTATPYQCVATLIHRRVQFQFAVTRRENIATPGPQWSERGCVIVEILHQTEYCSVPFYITPSDLYSEKNWSIQNKVILTLAI